MECTLLLKQLKILHCIHRGHRVDWQTDRQRLSVCVCVCCMAVYGWDDFVALSSALFQQPSSDTFIPHPVPSIHLLHSGYRLEGRGPGGHTRLTYLDTAGLTPAGWARTASLCQSHGSVSVSVSVSVLVWESAPGVAA